VGLEQFIPKGSVRSSILTSFERITQPVTDFIRGNPLVSTAAVGIGTTGLVAVASTIRRKKRKKVTKRKPARKRKKAKVSRRKRVVKKRKKVTHRSPRHKGHKRVSFTTKDGKRVNFLVKKKRVTHKTVRRRRR